MSEEKKKMKGVVVFFVNLYPDLGQDVRSTMNMIKEMNQPLANSLTEDGQYVALFVPTHREATRVEKIDYDGPFPRYMAKSLDIQKVGLQDGLKKKKKNMFQPEGSGKMRGIISLFCNFHPEIELDVPEIMELIRSINSEALAAIAQDGQYQILIVPTTKEASRVEKVDWESPFPRFVPKNTGKKGSVPKKVVTVVTEEDEDDDEDELEDEKDAVEDTDNDSEDKEESED